MAFGPAETNKEAHMQIGTLHHPATHVTLNLRTASGED